MTRARLIQNAFSSGEIDPRLFGRNDFQRFKTGLASSRGFVPLLQGGFTRAPGTSYLGTTNGNQAARRIPFTFAVNDAVELEFTPLVMRVWRYGVLVESGGAPYELTTPFDAGDLPNLDLAQDGDVAYLVDGRNPVQKLSRLALDNWTIAPADFRRGPFRVPNLDEGRTIQAEYLTGVGIVDYWVPDETLVIGDKRQYGSNIYTFGGVRVGASGPFLNGSCGPRAPKHTSGTRDYDWFDISAGGVLFARWTFTGLAEDGALGSVILNGTGDPFEADMVGSLLLLEPLDFDDVPIWTGNTNKRNGKLCIFGDNIYRHVDGSDSGVNPPIHAEGTRMTDGNSGATYQWVSGLRGVVRITSYVNANQVEADVLMQIPRPCFDGPTYLWSEGAWSERHGYPAAIEVHEQRLFAAATPTDPRTVWASVQGDFENFLPGDLADEAFAYTLAAGSRKNRVLWLTTARRGLFIGSLGEVHRAHSGSDNEAIGPTAFVAEIVATDGGAPCRPITPYGDPAYVVRGGGRVQEIKYSFEVDGSRPLDLSLPSQHLGAASPIAQIEWQSAPWRAAWMRREDGLLLVMIYEPEQDVLGWAPVPLAGGFVEDICISPAADGLRDVVRLTVRRVLNGATVRAVEEVADNEPALVGAAGLLAFNHLFCATHYEGAETASLSVPQLQGETVVAWTDAGEFEGLTVGAGGALTLPVGVTEATVGLFDGSHQAETLPLQALARDGDARGRRIRLHAGGGMVLHRTSGGYLSAVQRDFGAAERVGIRQEIFKAPFAADAVQEFSGAVRLDATSGHALDVRQRIVPRGNRPLTVLAMVAEMEEEGP